MRNRLALVVVAALVAGAQLGPANAASTGLAYDSVSKFSPGGDPSSFQPGTFETDFQTASQPAPAQSHGGMFGGLANAVGGMNSMMRMMQTGTAERHYVAGSKERTDSLSTQTATIVDCAARTLTTLDLAKKTYTVVSLDATPGPTTHANRAPGPTATDDGSKVALTLTNKNLGSKTIENVPTNGYNSNVLMTVTKPGQKPQTMDMNMIAYYSAYAQPTPVCPRPTYTAMSGPPMMAGYGFLQRALRASNGDSRFSVNASGPALPAGKLSLFDVVAMGGQAAPQGRGGMVILSERGNVHPVSDNDPVFSVPAGFTKVQ
ncbi:MAG: hypothetical protein ACLPSH_12125 [Vulcanimicrobiaceae bacterium]